MKLHLEASFGLFTNLSLNMVPKILRYLAQKASTMQTWQRFVDFILRHLTQISIKYTDWEEDQYTYFCEALDFSEQIEGAALSLADLRKRAKLLKDEKGRQIGSTRNAHRSLYVQ